MPKPRDKHFPSKKVESPAQTAIRLGKYSIPMPGSHRQRLVLGVCLVVGGVFGFLPILGFWMIPLGLVVLSVDSPRVRRGRRRLEVRWGRWRKRPKRENSPS
jgi:hypothetical protein